MNILTTIGNQLSAIITISVFIGGIFAVIRKISKLGKTIEDVLKDFPDIKTNVEKHSKAINKQEDQITELEKKLEVLTKNAAISNELILCIAREKLLRILQNVIDEHFWNDQDELMVTTKMYNAYLDAGGNSGICLLWDKAIKMPIK